MLEMFTILMWSDIEKTLTLNTQDFWRHIYPFLLIPQHLKQKVKVKHWRHLNLQLVFLMCACGKWEPKKSCTAYNKLRHNKSMSKRSFHLFLRKIICNSCIKCHNINKLSLINYFLQKSYQATEIQKKIFLFFLSNVTVM